MRDPLRDRDALLRKLQQYSDAVRGSINSVCARCSRAHCICEKGTSRKAYRLTYKDSQQRTRIVYIPRGRLPEIRRKTANYSRLRKTMERLIEINVEIFKRAAGN
jgi:hypothetical protein